jgi:MFS family permease
MVFSGIVALTTGYVVASQATSLPMLYLAYGCGVGVGLGLSYVPSIGAVQTWFSIKRAQASGVATAGIGLGTLLLPFIVGRLVPTLGWRDCFLVLALVVAVVGTPAALLVRRRARSLARVVVWKTSPSFRAAWATPGFAPFYTTIVLGSFCTFIPYVHIVPASRDLGLSTEAGTELVALIGIGNVFGRFVLAGFGDRLGPVRLLAALTAVVAASFLLWVAATNFAMLAIFAVVFGAAYGGCVGLYPAVAARLFGVGHIGAMLGYLYTGVGIAALLGPSVAGYAFDYTGTYLAPLLASAAAAAVGAILTLRLRDSKVATTKP